MNRQIRKIINKIIDTAASQYPNRYIDTSEWGSYKVCISDMFTACIITLSYVSPELSVEMNEEILLYINENGLLS